ncbi:MAG: phenylalanine--tRNA ligase subunit beta [Acidimicrobiales bacterium]|nr:MAG: phenylalanine--tRNA ligase subunit beta [Acidimicrobiales bacterium]
MRVPLSWLRDFAPFETDPTDVSSVAALAATLSDLGMVVDGMETVGEGLGGVVVARVTEIGAIKGADRIRRVLVDAGGEESVEVVCGAWNFAVGDLVPLATVGAVLPGDFTITARRMKGVVSHGMLCSGRELRLSEDSAGILVLDAATGAEPGTPLSEALGLEPDAIFDLDIETNRPDALSMAGVARDAAARLKLPFGIPEPLVEAGEGTEKPARVSVEASDLCPRLAARVLTGVTVGPSPRWLARRLALAGMRPINSVVDASNYVMLELGQPTHPYDLDRLGGGGLLVRRARPGEVLVSLDGVSRRLGAAADGSPADDCLICDASGQAVGIAGIMGGESTEIHEETQRVLLEAAHFAPMAIARTSKRLGLRSEASVRFERGTDPEGIPRAVARFCQLVATSGAGAAPVAGELVDVRAAVPPRPAVRVRVGRVNAVLGTDLDEAAIRGYLAPIGFESRPDGVEGLEVVIPSFRPDASREIDVIEEVARHHGYSRILRTRPTSPQVGALTGYQRDRRRVLEILAGTGATEAWTPTLLRPGDHQRVGLGGPSLEVENPLAREESVLRRTLLPGLLGALEYNAAHRHAQIRLCEVGHVFGWPPDGGPALPDEREYLGVALAGPGDDALTAVATWRTLAAALRLERADLVAGACPGLHPTRSCRLVVAATGTELGVLGEVDPDVLAGFGLAGRVERVGWIEVDLALLLSVPRRSEQLRPVSRFPSSDIDLAFLVEESTSAGEVEVTLAAAAGELAEEVTLFDVYRGGDMGEGRRSLAWHLRFAALDHTLTDEEVSSLRQRCVQAVEAAHPAHLRGK